MIDLFVTILRSNIIVEGCATQRGAAKAVEAVATNTGDTTLSTYYICT